MKIFTLVATSCMLAIGLTLSGCALNGITHDETFEMTGAIGSVDYHMATLQQDEGRAKMLEGKIQRLQDRIKTWEEKPYRDPKGFRRSGWKRLVGTWEQELNDLREQIVRHKNEITRLQASTNSPYAPSGNDVGNS